jgi:hypothetical protein
MTVGPVGMDTRGFRTRQIWIQVEKLTRVSYRVGYPKYIGSGLDKILTHEYLVDTRNINIPL